MNSRSVLDGSNGTSRSRAPDNGSKSLSIVIPALNEEESIGSTIERCLAAKDVLRERTQIERVEIIVVSDGSTDRTAEIAGSYKPVQVIAYEKNLGYGAAIKLGFEKSTGEILGFLDADGTCDPRFFVDLCNLAIRESADVVLGSRLHKGNKMPAIRWFGNRMYAILMSYFSNRRVNDTASGMRVVRRDALPKLYPLPDGLHFTPAMTCKALLKDDIIIRELPMPYHERTGRSKLSVFKDGVRFLHIISEIALTYRPLKFFGGPAALLFLVALAYSVGPLHAYFSLPYLPDGFIYRLTAINTAMIAGLTLLTVGISAERVAAAMNQCNRKRPFLERLLLRISSKRNMFIAGITSILCGIGLNLGSLFDYLSTGRITYHWAWINVGSLLVLAGMQLSALGVFELLLTRIFQRNGAGKIEPARSNNREVAFPRRFSSRSRLTRRERPDLTKRRPFDRPRHHQP